jgi:hypothetical protein
MTVRQFAVHIAVTFALLGCSGDSVSPPPIPAVGSWTLSMYNGVPIPATASSAEGSRTDITGGDIQIVRGGSFLRSTEVTTTTGSDTDVVKVREVGDWVFSNDDVVTLIPVGEDVRAAFVTNNQLTVTEGHNKTYVYVRTPASE